MTTLENVKEWAGAEALHPELRKTIKEAAEMLEEYQSMFSLRWEADMRAIDRWRKDGYERELSQPDHADMVVWLLQEVTRLEKRGQELTEYGNDKAEEVARVQGLAADAYQKVGELVQATKDGQEELEGALDLLAKAGGVVVEGSGCVFCDLALPSVRGCFHLVVTHSGGLGNRTSSSQEVPCTRL